MSHKPIRSLLYREKTHKRCYTGLLKYNARSRADLRLNLLSRSSARECRCVVKRYRDPFISSAVTLPLGVHKEVSGTIRLRITDIKTPHAMNC